MHVLQRIAGIVAAIGLASCLPRTSHECASNAECGAGGTCEPSGACSFGAGDCPSGRRYGDGTGPLSGQCVDDGAAIDAAGNDGGATDGSGVDASNVVIDVGRGLDGPLMVTGATAGDVRVNTCAKLASSALPGATMLLIDPSTLVAANGGTNLGTFVADRRVIIWQTAGLAAGSITIGDQAPFNVPLSTGRYELALLSTVGPGGITLTLAAPITGAYTTTAQVCRVPEFTDVTVGNPTGSVTAQLRPPFWNGVVGGLLAFHASGTVTVGGVSGSNGNVSATGRGLREGLAITFAGTPDDCVGLIGDPENGGGNHKGEGLATTLYSTSTNGPANTFGAGNAVNGGGGGNCHNAGGGGGGNGGAGGRGGYQANADLLGNGQGGAALILDPRVQLALGGGGGAGDDDDGMGGDGGMGGGVVWMRAANLTCSSVRAAGAGGGNTSATTRDGAGGGGGGGMIVAEIRSLAACTFDATGGAGGRGYIGNNSFASGPGGGGGGGRVYLRTGARAIDPLVSVTGGASGVVFDGTGTHGAVAGTSGVYCGNGVVEAGETCDDGGNADPSDGCDLCR